MYPLKVEIVELDTTRTLPSKNAADRRLFHFKLSVAPPVDWIDLFDRTWTVPRRGVWRPVKVVDDYLVIDCPPQEVMGWHLADLKRDLRSTTKRYNKFMKAKLKGSMREAEALEAERDLMKGGWWQRLKWLLRHWNENLWL